MPICDISDRLRPDSVDHEPVHLAELMAENASELSRGAFL